jgi:hypothetical protein
MVGRTYTTSNERAASPKNRNRVVSFEKHRVSSGDPECRY